LGFLEGGWRSDVPPVFSRPLIDKRIAKFSSGLDVVWPQFLIIAVIGASFLALAVLRFRQVTAQSM